MAYTPWASSEAVRRSMQGNRGRDTVPELRIRREAHRLGLRYFVDRQPLKALRRRADMVFPSERVAVFVDGCYWHGCSDHHVPPRTNDSYWAAKVTRNRARDLDTRDRLEAAGWTVLRFWEHDEPLAAAGAIHAAVTAQRTDKALSA